MKAEKNSLIKEAAGCLPTLKDFGFTDEEIKAKSKPDKRMYYVWKAGEENAK